MMKARGQNVSGEAVKQMAKTAFVTSSDGIGPALQSLKVTRPCQNIYDQRKNSFWRSTAPKLIHTVEFKIIAQPRVLGTWHYTPH